MKEFAFVSDFDGTLTDRDFYHIVMDKYLKEWAWDYYNEWKKTKRINVDFLNKIFGSMDRSEEEILEDILGLPLDPYAMDFIKRVEGCGGDFYILSAGTSYYIKKLLAHYRLNTVTVISMEGVYKNRGIQILPDPKSEFYSELWGVDKEKVILSLKQNYSRIYFSGDSDPDVGAAKAADCAFARNDLKELLSERKIPYVPFNKFNEVEEYMLRQGWLK
ncbi:HAD superfamily phosphoserine phosphatase-like hydrolase/2,3-diketo-5-methylthio-1-phosphopentane phosphatase [Ruminiclostridium sufflavum DSM 19573]|uniref:HAD superfamily phosphoserine phosphatase-like hydrolase/2,3-diketo-5-methylthio-1-phosphopentane phosphatase n=1 Tax=Ruminiclostridium sufflavum DSM 19573 TaxID=1121337 RepID=A0A318XUJ0_9FIRM|nr:MtnX-like HAD-IB family phosphatase [Ruminiclostridium sufflavum]PYG90330.1 HAD superfamily phosphoserine phosphatase-like hydrolase/2,3-diketo-5-methylthio-1-phosphopentane phosphatase [Ruminiclostridium sufflavum DSM 19573]